MKTLTLFIIIVLLTIQASRAQTDSVVLNKFYHTWVIPERGHRGESGVLYEIKDSSVVVSNSPWRKNYYEQKFDETKIDIRDIKEIRVRRQGQGFAVLVGGITGMVAGAIISAAYIDHLEKTMNPVGFAFGGFIQGILPFIVSTGVGIGVGLMVSPKLKIHIGGSQEKFDKNKIRLNKYALKGNSTAELFNGRAFSKLRDSVADIDGNTYNTLALGGQVWMAENLKVTRFRDGSAIPLVDKNYYGNGNRYNWSSVSDPRKICPAGWHVPTLGDWTSLFNSLGGEEIAGTRMEQSFGTNGSTGQWWSSTGVDAGRAQSFYMNTATFGVMFTTAEKKSGLSVRCMRDN